MSERGPITWQEQVESAARRFLQNHLLSERAARISRLARWVSQFAELGAVACDRRAVEAAAWFQDAWCADDVNAGRLDVALVVIVPPTALQREHAADLAAGLLRGLVDDATRTTAAQAIRLAGDRETTVPEAHVLAEATDLDAIGPLWVISQVARCFAEDRPLASIVAVWERQIEYGYWPKRIDQTLRFQRSRELARQRCAAVEGFMLALRSQLDASDRHVAPETGS